MKSFKLTLVAASTILLAACSSTPVEKVEVEPKSTLPSWVSTPMVEGGFAATECVKTVASMSVLKTKATALARASIAKQIDVEVVAMDKTYQSLTETKDGTASGDTFESVSKQITNKVLKGTRPVKVDYVETFDGTQLCVMVTLDPKSTQAYFDAVVAKSDREISPQDNAILYQEFKAHKAQQELALEIK